MNLYIHHIVFSKPCRFVFSFNFILEKRGIEPTAPGLQAESSHYTTRPSKRGKSPVEYSTDYPLLNVQRSCKHLTGREFELSVTYSLVLLHDLLLNANHQPLLSPLISKHCSTQTCNYHYTCGNKTVLCPHVAK